jgi:hypothetical protein
MFFFSLNVELMGDRFKFEGAMIRTLPHELQLLEPLSIPLPHLGHVAPCILIKLKVDCYFLQT